MRGNAGNIYITNDELKGYLIRRAKEGGILIIGKPGDGKTTCLQALLDEVYSQTATSILTITATDELDVSQFDALNFSGPFATDIDIQGDEAKDICHELLQKFISKEKQADVIIVDSAKLLSRQALMDIRDLCSNGTGMALVLHANSFDMAIGILRFDCDTNSYTPQNQVIPLETEDDIRFFRTIIHVYDRKIAEIAEVTMDNGQIEYHVTYQGGERM